MIRTTPILFIDSNVPVYAWGFAHRLKEPSRRVLELLPAHPARFITSAEVLQEVLHFASRRGVGLPLFSNFAILMAGRVEAVHDRDVAAAAEVTANHPGLQARDGVHAAVMRRLGIRHIVSADARLSRIEGVERLDPADVDAWSAVLLTAS